MFGFIEDVLVETVLLEIVWFVFLKLIEKVVRFASVVAFVLYVLKLAEELLLECSYRLGLVFTFSSSILLILLHY